MGDTPHRLMTEKFTGSERLVRTELEYRPVPYKEERGDGGRPVWRVRFTLASDPTQQFGLDINGPVTLGRKTGTNDLPGLIDLNAYDAAGQGVSRRHAQLRPTATNLLIIDLGSTNGTLRNGRSIGVNTPYSLVDGDTVALGRLRFLIQIEDRPSLAAAPQEDKASLADALLQIAKAITSHLDVDVVLDQVAETARALTAAGETGIWLVDEASGNLLLEAEKGIEDNVLRRMHVPIDEDSLVGEVLRTGKPLRTSREPGGKEIKVNTGFLVEALVYVPISLGGIPFGVLSATHREPSKRFSRRDERLLEAIADFAAIAIQNARLYQVTDEALAGRVKELAALNQLSYTVSASLDLNRVHEVLVEQVDKHWPVEALRLYLLDEEEQRLRPLGSNGRSGEENLPRLGKGLLGQVARAGKVLVCNDVAGHPDYLPQVDDLDGSAPRSLLCAPLRVQEHVVGVLALYNKEDGSFTDEDAARLRAFTNPVATAIENARLFAESEQRRAAIQATAQTLPQPLLILGEHGQVLVANERAQRLMRNSLPQLFDAISRGLGRTLEVAIGEETYLSTSEHVDEVGTIVVMQDISYVKELEAARSDFMHTLSHDMKSPLTSIVGYTHLLERTLPLEEKHRYYMEQIKSSADRILNMISQLLQTVDGELTMDSEWQSCRLEPLLSKVLRDVGGAAVDKGINLTLVREGEPRSILGDEPRLYHSLLNLVDNAVKFSPPDSEIISRLEFGEEEITVQVMDEGPGIPDEDLPHIFEKYYRGANSDRAPGSGMGLSVVRAHVEAHGGAVTAANRPQGGAIFTITLPDNPAIGEDLPGQEDGEA